MMKRILFLLILISVQVAVWADDEPLTVTTDEGQQLVFQLSESDHTAILTQRVVTQGKGGKQTTTAIKVTGNLVIPSVVKKNGEEYSVLGIGDGAFKGNTALTGVVIPESMRSIGASAFSGAGLKMVTLTKETTLVGTDVFLGCTGLTDVYADDMEVFFYNYFSAKDRNVSRRFYVNGKQVTDIVIPEGTTVLPDALFTSIEGINSVTLPSTLTVIGSYTFYGTTPQNIYCYATVPPQVVSGSFSNMKNTVLRIPHGTAEAYAAAGWNAKFFLVVEMAGLGDDGNIEGSSRGDILTLTEEGTLGVLLSQMDVEKRIKHLTLRGPINWADLRVLIAGEGRLEELDTLNLRDVTLIPGGDYYASTSYFGDGTWFTSVSRYYLSTERKHEHKSDGLSSASTQYDCYYDYNLAGAFMGTKLKSIVMPKGINEVGQYTFYKSPNLQTVIYDEPLVYVGARAFEGCNKLRYAPDLSHVSKMGISAFKDCHLLMVDSIVDLSSLDTIPGGAFSGCTLIDSVVFSRNLRCVEEKAFQKCGLKTFLTYAGASVGDYAFSGCNRLALVRLYDGVEHLGRCAFSNCPSLTHVEMSEQMLSLSNDMFQNTPWFDALPFDNGVKYIGRVAMMTDGSTSVSFREGTVAIADYFNYKCNDNGDYSRIYKNDMSPNSITLPESLRRIGVRAFYANPIASVTLPEGVEEIGDAAFYGCQIVTLALSASLRSVGLQAFADNKKLMRLSYDVPDANNFVSFGTGNTSLESQMGIFSNCSSLESVTFGPHVRNIPSYTFSCCYSLLGAILPEGVQTIGAEAFYKCGLRELTLPNSLERIGEGAFWNCSSFTSIRSAFKQPSLKPQPSFTSSSVYKNATLYVPVGTKDLYLAVWSWSQFENIVEDESLDVKGVRADNDEQSVSFSLDGRKGKLLRHGVCIEKRPDGKTVKVMRR